MKDFAKSIRTGNAGDVIHRDGDFKIKYNGKENSYELYFNSIYYDTFHTKEQALDKIELYKRRKEARAGNSKVGNSGWERGSSGNFEWSVLHFDEPSGYGINDGKISKLFIRDKETKHVEANYDRGWDVRPTDKVKSLYNELIKKYN